MEKETQYQELSDEELTLVAGGSTRQTNKVWISQQAIADGVVAVATNIATVTALNFNAPVHIQIGPSH